MVYEDIGKSVRLKYTPFAKFTTVGQTKKSELVTLIHLTSLSNDYIVPAIFVLSEGNQHTSLIH